jgi:glycosyltransferase involved in cell wall biosynthesis
MRYRILMITYNRLEYTAMSLERLCATVPENGRITVWDNGSSDALRAMLKGFENHPRIERIIYNPTNDKLRGPTNWFWENSTDAEYLSKVDDDGLMPDGWLETLDQAFQDIPKAGILGTWRFPDEDFLEAAAARKIHSFGAHRLLRNCWVEGSGYLMKREVFVRCGKIREDESFTTYCTRAAAAGYINGWYYPFLYQEHMDDPRAPHTGMKTAADFERLMPLSARTFDIRTMEDWTNKLRELARSLQVCSYDPGDYLGWKAKVRQKIRRWLGRPYVPRA